MQPPVFHGRKFLNGGRNEGVQLVVIFPAGRVEQALPFLLFGFALDELVQPEITPFHDVAGNKRPFLEHDGRSIALEQCERVPAQDIAFQQKAHSLKAFCADGKTGNGVGGLCPKTVKTLAAFCRVIFQ